MCSTSVKVLKCLLTSNQLYLAMAVEWKYDWGGGAGAKGCEAADYLCEASACEGQELGGGLKPP